MAQCEWVSLGEIAVDGGRIVVGDQGYAHAELDRLRVASDYHGGEDGVRKLGAGVGGSLAMLINSGFGDGGYEVLARYTKRTKVVAEVRIVFVEEGKDRCAENDCQFGYVHFRNDQGLLLSTKPCSSCSGTGLVEVAT